MQLAIDCKNKTLLIKKKKLLQNMKNFFSIVIIILAFGSLFTSAAAALLSQTLAETLCYEGFMVCSFAFVVLYANKLSAPSFLR
jgi:hypothetical protein